MNRRDMMRAALALAGTAWVGRSGWARTQAEAEPIVMTVRGPIRPEEMGVTLPHEHVIVDFVGADQVGPDRYDPDEVFAVALPFLERARALGCQTLVECTPAYLARDAALLKRLSEASGLHLLTNTGYYAANQGRHLPRHAHTETTEQLSARWLREWRQGIEDTGIRPGFQKIGVGAGPLSDVERRLVHASAMTHRESGLTIGIHTGSGRAALEELDILDGEGVDGRALIWIHAQSESDPDLHARAAERGAWVEFDGVGPDTIERHVGFVLAMKDRGFLDHVLVSHDAGWYSVGEPGGGDFRGFDTLFTDFLPALKHAGLTDAEIQTLTVDNPREAFTVRVRAT